MKTNSKEQKKDNFFRLEEMHESMQKSLENIVKVKNEQKMLIEIVKSSDKSKMFENFTSELEKGTEDLDKQYNVLFIRTTMLSDLLKNVTDDQKQIINKLITILNVFGND